MLTINAVRSANDAQKYYSVSDYYQAGQETVGQWVGELAKRLGLTGTVDQERFNQLCQNINPLTGKKLTVRAKARVGYDFTFSAPKSFSVVEALAGDEERARLFSVFDEAVTETVLEDIEPDMQCRVRKDGADYDRVTGNLIGAGYDHSTARPINDNTPPDPHRHRHVFIQSATFDPIEKRIKAAQFGSLKRDGEYYAAQFYSRLASKLEAMGYVIDRRGGKDWEIAGVPQSVIDTFSKRTDQVEEEHKNRLDPKHPDYDPDYREEYKHELGAKTRAKKQKELTPAELRRAWRAQLTDGERDALAAVYGKEIAAGRKVTAAEAVEFAIADLSEKLSAPAERDVKRVALLFGLGDVTPEDIDRELKSPRHGLIVRDIDGRAMATTEALQREEDFIVGLAASTGTVEPVGVPGGLTRELPDGKSLNDEQWDIVTGLLNSSDRVCLVEGPAGAGKSWSLQKYDEAMGRAGEHVAYLASTSDAAEELAKEGFSVHTVAHFLLNEKLQQQARGGRVVVDESSMLGHKDAVRLYALARKLDLKLIHVAGPLQHGSVPRGALLHVLKTYAGVRPFRLTQIMRQERPDYREAVGLLSKGDTLAGFDALDRMGWVREVSDDSARVQAIAADYLQAVKDQASCLVISPTHREGAEITQAIRSGLRAAGILGEKEQEFTRLVPVDASEARRGLASTYRTGDVLIFFNNAKGGIKKGERLVVSDPAKVPLSEAPKFSLYRPEKTFLTVGDKIRFTGTVKTLDGKHTLRNGQVRTVAGVTGGKNLRLDNGWIVSKDAGLFRHGFVETSFGSQGRNVQRVILGMASQSLPAINQEMMYVGASRGKQSVTLYTDSKDDVRQAIQRSSRKLAALDLRAAPPTPRPSERWRRHTDRRRRLAYAERSRAAQGSVKPSVMRPQERQVSYGR